MIPLLGVSWRMNCSGLFTQFGWAFIIEVYCRCQYSYSGDEILDSKVMRDSFSLCLQWRYLIGVWIYTMWFYHSTGLLACKILSCCEYQNFTCSLSLTYGEVYKTSNSCIRFRSRNLCGALKYQHALRNGQRDHHMRLVQGATVNARKWTSTEQEDSWKSYCEWCGTFNAGEPCGEARMSRFTQSNKPHMHMWTRLRNGILNAGYGCEPTGKL